MVESATSAAVKNQPQQQPGGPKAANPVKKKPPEPKKTEEAKEQDKTLVGHMREQGERLATGVTKNVVNQGAAVAKHGTKTMLNVALFATFKPLSIAINAIPGGTFLATPIVNWLSNRLTKYLENKQIKIDVEPREAIMSLVTGEFDNLSESLVNVLSDFVNNSLDPKIREALETGSPMKIVGAMLVVLKGMWSNLNKIEAKGGIIGKFFTMLGNKIPLVNRLGKGYRPWAAGGLTFLFGGMLLRGAYNLFKWIFFLGGITAIGTYAKRMLFGGANSALFGGGLGGRGGAPGSTGNSMVDMGMNLAKMLGGGASSPAAAGAEGM